MKRILLYSCLSLTVFACKPGVKTTENTSTSVNNDSQSKTTTTDAEAIFDINKIPISNADLGEFPYLSAPEKYDYGNYAGGMQKSDISDYDKEYFVVNGKLVLKEGKTCKVGIDVLSQENTQFNSLIVEKSFDKAIKDLGGVQVNNVPLPQAEIERIGNKELIDKQYGYSIGFNSLDNVKTYVIRTKDKEVWIQFSLVNKESGRITFLEKGGLETLEIKKITANQMKSDIDANGKAILDINFDKDKSDLLPDGKKAVDEIFTLMKDNPSLQIAIEGHTDNSGTADRNKKLSAERANKILRSLTDGGIAANRMTANGYGAERPLVANDNVVNMAKNRRVELVKK